MNPFSHLMISWLAAERLVGTRRERVLVTLAGVIPDLDGLGIVVDFARRDSLLGLYGHWHHQLTHGLPAALAFSLAVLALTRRRRVALAAFFVYHLHLFCDLIGARGPDGIWTVPWLAPLSDALTLSLDWQWPINGWQNLLIGFILVCLSLHGSWQRGRSPLELLSLRGDTILTSTLRVRFGMPVIIGSVGGTMEKESPTLAPRPGAGILSDDARNQGGFDEDS